jgi:hypothetical protein
MFSLNDPIRLQLREIDRQHARARRLNAIQEAREANFRLAEDFFRENGIPDDGVAYLLTQPIFRTSGDLVLGINRDACRQLATLWLLGHPKPLPMQETTEPASDSTDRKLTGTESGKASGQADNETDTKEILLPESSDVIDLCRKLQKELGPGKTQIAIALDFVRGNREKAENLLRQCRRFPHLWKPTNKPDKKRTPK